MITHTGTVYDGDVFDLEEAVNKAEFLADNVFEDVTLESRFAETWCSQCGKGLGPGNHGVSHCEDHTDVDLQNDIDWIREHDDNV